MTITMLGCLPGRLPVCCAAADAAASAAGALPSHCLRVGAGGCDMQIHHNPARYVLKRTSIFFAAWQNAN
jgi:hypothetical protein